MATAGASAPRHSAISVASQKGHVVFVPRDPPRGADTSPRRRRGGYGQTPARGLRGAGKRVVTHPASGWLVSVQVPHLRPRRTCARALRGRVAAGVRGTPARQARGSTGPRGGVAAGEGARFRRQPLPTPSAWTLPRLRPPRPCSPPDAASHAFLCAAATPATGLALRSAPRQVCVL